MDFNNQREFLSSLAKELNFDPLVASAWSSITVDMVKSKKVIFFFYIFIFLKMKYIVIKC